MQNVATRIRTKLSEGVLLLGGPPAAPAAAAVAPLTKEKRIELFALRRDALSSKAQALATQSQGLWAMSRPAEAEALEGERCRLIDEAAALGAEISRLRGFNLATSGNLAVQ